MATRVTGPGPAQMKLLAVKLHQADPELRRELRRQFRAIAAPTVADVRASILSMPSHHDGTLRGEIARTVSASVGATRSGVRLDIVSSGRKMPPGKGELPRDTNAAKWNHPVFARPMGEIIAHMAGKGHGRGWVWVKQVGKPHWFETAVSKNAPRARAAVLDAMNSTARRLS
jgi:hypothetical protein